MTTRVMGFPMTVSEKISTLLDLLAKQANAVIAADWKEVERLNQDMRDVANLPLPAKE